MYHDQVSERLHVLLKRIKIWAMSKSWFWKVRTGLRRGKFFLEASTHKRSNSIYNARTSLKILATLAWIAIKSLFWVALSLTALLVVENFVRSNTKFLQPLSASEKDYSIEQLRLYAGVLTTIFSIYFATIGIILSAGYTKLRTDIIHLLTSEQVGGVYSRVLVLSAAFCFAATSLPLLGLEPGFFIHVVATFVALASALALFPLGQRLFNFFDLNLVVHSEILPRIAKHIEGATKHGNSASLANHHSKVARLALEQLAYIDDHVKSDERGLEDKLPALTDDYSALLLYYLQQKDKIDHDSYWFPRRRIHQQWFLAGDNATSLALQTRSQLAVKEKADLNWLEDEVVARLSGHIELAFERGNFKLALKLINRFSVRYPTYAREFQFDVGMQELHKIRECIEAAFAKHERDNSSEGEKTRIAIADSWAALGSNLCLETLRRMITFEKELKKFFVNDVWTEDSLHSLPAFLQAELAFIVERIDFEHAIEGHRLSKPKYVQQLAVQKLLQRYAEVLPAVIEFYDKVVKEFAESLHKLGSSQAATQVVLASLHSYWKLPRWFDELSPLFERYGAYAHYSEKQYALPEIDVGGMAERLVKARYEFVEMLGRPDLVSHIFSGEHDDDLPDHFGQVYFELAEACIHALEQNDEEKFGKVFPMFFSLALLASNSKFADPTLDVNDEFRLHLISTVINDLASVLGFAILYGAYFDNPKLSEAALGKFLAWIEPIEEKQQYLKRMVLLSNPHSFSHSASPRGLIRINWKMAFERLTRQGGYGDQMDFQTGRPHESKIVNEFLRSHSDASHLFFAAKVLPLIDPVDFDIDYQIEGLAKRLQKEEMEAAE